MIPIGVGLVWLSYTTGIWGYCLVRGYNVKFTQLFAATWPANKGSSLATSAEQLQGNTAAAASAAVALGQPGGAEQLGLSPPTPSGNFPTNTQLTGL